MKARYKLVVGLAIFLGAAMDWVAFDRWQISGSVVDAANGQPLSSAWVLATFDGETPLLNLPIPPHPNARTSTCMGSQSTKTDVRGRFRFDHLTSNRPLANKRVHLSVFRPGWISTSRDTHIRSSLFLPSAETEALALRRGPGEARPGQSWPENIRARLPPDEFTHTEEFFATLRVLAQAQFLCGSGGDQVLLAAMEHALSIAKSFDERFRARARCHRAAEIQHERGTSWPFDCSNLKFKHQPSREVLALEEEFDPVLRAAKRNLQEASP